MSKVLVLFAHPALEKSRIHTRLIEQTDDHPDITFRDLYEEYPDFDIDVKREQELLLQHDIVLFQHPFYWYSSPAIIKEWQDLVLEHKWAYGSNGTALAGKKWMNVISCGGSRQSYSIPGLNRFTIKQLLAPVEQTATLCNMQFLPPFVIHGTHLLDAHDIRVAGTQYKEILNALVEDRFTDTQLAKAFYINDLVNVPRQF
jgi:glutathione-regulated potassium-efflux system ancillary protein KefG